MKLKLLIDEIIQTTAAYFTFSRLQRRGSIVLLAIIMLLCSGFYFIEFLEPREKFNATVYENEIRLFEKSLEELLLKSENEPGESKYPEKKPAPVTVKHQELFMFNPNILSEEGFMKLGLSEKQAGVIIKYRSKGGVFRNREDLKKMYCISDKEYSRLAPYVEIPEIYSSPDKFKKDRMVSSDKLKPPAIVELNTATHADLDSIRGIGPAIASSVVRYREKLGGFVQPEQLLEVYGIDTALYEKLKPVIRLELQVTNKININTADAGGLRHPYMPRNVAGLIINYRKLHGPFKSLEALRKLALVNEELYVKLAPYLTTE